MATLTRPITSLKGVGPRLAEKLARLRLRQVQDLLFHLPLRYQDRTRLVPIGALRPGGEALIAGRIELAEVAYRRRRSLLCRIHDGTGSLTLRFFYFSGVQQQALARGRHIRCFGEVRLGPAGLEMIHPEYMLMDEPESLVPETHLTPIYPATEGVHQATLRKLIDQALERHLDDLEECLPGEALDEYGLYDLREALRFVHHPPVDASIFELSLGQHPAQQRLAFEELLAHHLSLRQLRARNERFRAPPIAASGKLLRDLLASLPFPLTGAQQRVIEEITRDLRAGAPMQRLVQGDVGCGKTLVAAAACALTIEGGVQAAVMAPTELLAEQHARNFARWFSPLGIQVAWLAGKTPARQRAVLLEKLASGEAMLAVGTHALFQEQVVFDRLGLIVVDEQHRFGVHQRLQLRAKGQLEGQHPHQLIMSATPIPRTLAQTLFADLDVSTIDELPPGRTPVETAVISETRRAEVVERVRAACLEGRQAYWVCPLIEESGEDDGLNLQAATEMEAGLRGALPELRVGLVHGRLRPAEKERLMSVFKAGEIDLLVATTVIEVGVDVPNASLMIIENAERLGLAQLHQLRGRVGRGSARSSCILMYHAPLSEMARKRLACLRETNDGFEIARQDLEMRGPGEMFGARQTGLPALHIADLARDRALLPNVVRLAQALLDHHPERVPPLVQRWLGRVEDYVNV